MEETRPDIDVTFVCPKCGRQVTWTQMVFPDGSVAKGLDWQCKYCDGDVLILSEDRRGYLAHQTK